MAYAGYLIKLGGSNGTSLPFKYFKAESYSCTPNQRMESEANRAVTGKLVRKTVSNTATKIEFETPYMTNADRAALNTLLTTAMGSSANRLERKITLEYYNDETDSYTTGDFYMPDVQYQIYKVDNTRNVITYSPVRYAFIEYGKEWAG